MARTYTSTITIKCWKEHTCSSCGAVFSYPFQRKVSGKARTVDKAQANMRANAAKAMQNEVDLHPCPACGIYQPDMIGQQRVKAHKFTLVASVAVFLVLVILRASHAVQADTVSHFAIIAAILVLIQFVMKDIKNINRNIDANRQTAADRVAAGTIQFTGESTLPAAEWVSPPRTLVQNTMLTLLAVAVLSISLAELLRVVRGWPINDQSYPPVVGPGDETRIYMTDKIISVKGYWRGTASATILEAGGKPLRATATANQNDWGQRIEDVKTDEQDNHTTPWVNVTMPGDPSLAGKVVDCSIVLQLQYPEMSGPAQFRRVQSTMTRSLSLHLASPGAGEAYNSIWWGGTIGGFCLMIICGVILLSSARALQKMAAPTKVLQPAPPAPPRPPTLPA